MRSVVAVMLALWSAAAWAQVSALDSAGRRVSLPAPALRIVSVAPHVTELLFAAGAGSRVVAVSEYSDYPEVARRLPRVASSSAVNIEEVLALRADLVIAWRLDATARSLDRLEALGIPVFYSEPHRLAEIPNAIEALGALAGTQGPARAAAKTLRAVRNSNLVTLQQDQMHRHGPRAIAATGRLCEALDEARARAALRAAIRR